MNEGIPWYEAAKQSNFIREYPVVVRFLRSMPEETETPKYGRPCWNFAVQKKLAPNTWSGEKTLSVTAKGLLSQLADFHPVEGKIFEIFREGEGSNTTYEVIPLLPDAQS